METKTRQFSNENFFMCFMECKVLKTMRLSLSSKHMKTKLVAYDTFSYTSITTKNNGGLQNFELSRLLCINISPLKCD